MTAPFPPESLLLDLAKLDALRRDLGGDFARVLGYFRADGEKLVGQVEEAARMRSAVALVRPAHTLKGDAWQLGAMPLGQVAEEVELAARAAVEDHFYPAGIVEAVTRLRPLLAQTLAALDRAAGTAPVRARTGFGRKAPLR